MSFYHIVKFVKTSIDLTEAPFFHVPLKFKNFTVLESCIHVRQNKDCQGSMFWNDHLIYYIHQGKNIFGIGKQTYEVKAGELIVLPKSTMITYEKCGVAEEDFLYHGILFFLKEEFIIDFLKTANIQPVQVKERLQVYVQPAKERLLKFFESLLPYFDEPENIDEGLIRLKMLELLYDLASTDHSFLLQMMQLRKQPVNDLSHVLESNYLNPVSLKDLAYLSGRSLSSFKRDFQQIYHTSPAQWIKEKRLQKAKELLTMTNMSVTDVCHSTGFENITHFSKIFKEHFGAPPSFWKSRMSQPQ